MQMSTHCPRHASGSVSLGLTCGVLAPDVSSWHHCRHMLHFYLPLCVCFVCARTRVLWRFQGAPCVYFLPYCLCLPFYFQSLLGYSLFLLATVVVFSGLPPNCSLRIHFVNKRRLLTFCVTVVLLCAAPRSLWGSTAECDLCECLVRPFFWGLLSLSASHGVMYENKWGSLTLWCNPVIVYHCLVYLL